MPSICFCVCIVACPPKAGIVLSEVTSIARLRHGKHATALLSEHSLLHGGR
jgi:hypothetical protein